MGILEFILNCPTTVVVPMEYNQLSAPERAKLTKIDPLVLGVTANLAVDCPGKMTMAAGSKVASRYLIRNWINKNKNNYKK